MGKDLEGNGLGKGFRQKADGRFEARVYIPGVKNPYCLYDRKLSTLKKKQESLRKRKLRWRNDTTHRSMYLSGMRSG